MRSSSRASYCGLPSLMQYRLRSLLPRRDEHDAAVRQIVRREVVPLLRREVGDDEPPQRVRRDRVFPDVPVAADPRRRGPDPRSTGPRIANSTLRPSLEISTPMTSPVTFRESRRDVALGRRRRRAIAQIEIGADGETQDVAQIGVDLELLVLVEQRPLRVRDRKIRRYRDPDPGPCRCRRCRRRRRRTQRRIMTVNASTAARPRRRARLTKRSVFRSSWKVPLHHLGAS